MKNKSVNYSWCSLYRTRPISNIRYIEQIFKSLEFCAWFRLMLRRLYRTRIYRTFRYIERVFRSPCKLSLAISNIFGSSHKINGTPSTHMCLNDFLEWDLSFYAILCFLARAIQFGQSVKIRSDTSKNILSDRKGKCLLSRFLHQCNRFVTFTFYIWWNSL